MKTDKHSYAWIAYLTIIGWIIAMVKYQELKREHFLIRHHLRQSFGVYILWFGVFVSFYVLRTIFGFSEVLSHLLATATTLANIGVLGFWVIGIFFASQQWAKPIPFIGRFFDEKLASFIR